VSFALVFFLAFFSSSPALSGQERTVPPELLTAEKIYLVNDLQAFQDSMLVFRQFRRDLRRLDRFEEVDGREEADLVAVLSGDPSVAERHGIINRGIPFPSGLQRSKVMMLVIFDAESDNLLYFDGVNWNTAANATTKASHTLLVSRLKAVLDGAG